MLLASVETSFAQAFSNELASGRLAIATRDCLRLCTRDPVVRFEPSGDALSSPSLDDLLRLTRAALAEQIPRHREVTINKKSLVEPALLFSRTVLRLGLRITDA